MDDTERLLKALEALERINNESEMSVEERELENRISAYMVESVATLMELDIPSNEVDKEWVKKMLLHSAEYYRVLGGFLEEATQHECFNTALKLVDQIHRVSATDVEGLSSMMEGLQDA